MFVVYLNKLQTLLTLLGISWKKNIFFLQLVDYLMIRNKL